MDKKTYEEALRLSEEVEDILKRTDLSDEERVRFQELRGQLAGTLMSPWIPFGWERRSAMLVISIVGLYFAMYGPKFGTIVFLLVPMFSPRCVGETCLIIGRFQSNKKY
jgi:hypothetical protein